MFVNRTGLYFLDAFRSRFYNRAIMNSRTLHKLKPCLLAAGDSSRAVGLLKSALKSVPRVAVKELQANNSFDRNTQNAVAAFQAGKNYSRPDEWM